MINSKEYIKLFLEHGLDDEPVVILYEVDLENERLALRSIDIFLDRNCTNIDDFYKDVIEIVSIPTVEELNSNVWAEEYHACLISEEEFEKIWSTHFYSGNLSHITPH